jgi:mRNA interferase HicA
MNGAELAKELKRLAKQRGVDFSYEPLQGKGSHGRLLFGDRLTTVNGPKKAIGPGLLHDMLKQLGLTKDDLP